MVPATALSLMASSRARTSTRSLSGSPECPFTQRQSILWRTVAACRRSHRSRFFTAAPPAVFQLRRSHLGIHSVIPRRTYEASVFTHNLAGYPKRPRVLVLYLRPFRVFGVVC